MKEHLGKIVAVIESEMSITDGTTKPRTRIIIQLTAASGKTTFLATKAFALNLREGCGLRSIMEGYTGTTDSKMMMQTMTRMGLLDGNQFKIGKLVGKDVWVIVKRVEKGDKVYHDIEQIRPSATKYELDGNVIPAVFGRNHLDSVVLNGMTIQGGV